MDRWHAERYLPNGIDMRLMEGYVTGGRVFGYRNVDVYNGVDAHGRPLRSHVERVGRIPEYVCYRRRVNGGCENAFRISVAEMNEMILSAVEEHALTPEAIEQVIHLSERDDAMELQAKLSASARTRRSASGAW